MAIDEETKRKTIDLYFNQRKTIREIAKIVKKSSRDVIAVVREHKQELRLQRMVTHGDNYDDNKKNVNQEKEDCKNPPLNTRAYRLFSQGMNPLQIAINLGVSEPEATKFYMEYLRLTQLLELPPIFKKLESVQAISYFFKLSSIAMAEKLTTKEVVRLLNLVKYNPVSSVEDRMEELKKMLIMLESEEDEKKNLLLQYNEKIRSAKSILEVWKKACKDVQEEFLRAYDEKQTLDKLVYEFKHNEKIYLEIQSIAEDKVKAFLADNNGIKLLEFALIAVTEAIRQDPQRELLIEKTPSVQNYDFDSEKSFLPIPWDYDYNFPHTAKEKVLDLSSELYKKLVKGVTNNAIYTTAGIVGGGPNFYPSFSLSTLSRPESI